MHNSLLEQSLRRLKIYIENEGYRGYDPFDALSAPVFRLPIISNSSILRFGFQQCVRRMPFNVRPVLKLPKGYNPVTLGLCVQAYTSLLQLDLWKRSEIESSLTHCLTELECMGSNGYNGISWGYDFDWQTRYGYIPARTPTVVATGIVVDGLYNYYRITGYTKARDLCVKAGKFVRFNLNKIFHNSQFCYSYSPLDKQQVFNATMKGARLLAQVYSITKDAEVGEEARRTIEFTVSRQQEDGSWPYAYGDGRQWIDNFHTAYILDCLDEYIHLTDDSEFRPYLEKGVHYYFSTFFDRDSSIPKYYHNRLYPIDSTTAAQSILTAIRFGKPDLAVEIAHWMVEHMQDASGYFYYRKHRWTTNRISYMRWSNAWMFAALTTLLYQLYDMD